MGPPGRHGEGASGKQREPAGRHGSRSSSRFRFPGANLGPGISGLEARRPAFPRRGLLPPPREPLRLRSGEQNLHTFPAPPAAPGGHSPHRPAPPHKKAPCRFIGKVLPSLQQFPRRGTRVASAILPQGSRGLSRVALQQFPRRSQSRGALLIN